MADEKQGSFFIFPAWANYLLPTAIVMAIGGGLYLPVLLGAGLSAETLNVGYQPDQPVPFSHALHVGEMGIDCRYCHNTVEQTRFAAIPPTATCINCHNHTPDRTGVHKGSARLAPVRESYNHDTPVEWLKVHDLPDYAYFDHSAHVNKGVGCVSCHGRVDKMDVVQQVAPLSMSWCLDCHRAPEDHLRPRSEVTNMQWQPPDGDQQALGARLKREFGIRDQAYMTSCSTCHR